MTSSPKIFVTGGTGFLGHSLLPMLVQQGYHVRALTRHPERSAWLHPLGVEIVQGDVEDEALIQQAVEGCQYVIHAAGRFSFWGKREQFEQTNVIGSRHVMQAAVNAGVEKFIHISTVVVVGTPLPDLLVDETHPTHPVDPYQRSKLRGEQVALDYFHDHKLPVVVLRPGAFYGPHGRYAFNRLFIEDPIKGLRIQLNNGRYITFPVYTGDVAASAINALKLGKAGEVYNICGETMTHHQANDIVSEEAGISRFRLNVPGWSMIALAYVWTALSEYTHIEPYYPLNLRSYVFNYWRVSSEKAKRDLNFQPISFRDGVRATLDWYYREGIVKPRRG
ncbi:MAG: NAD-dependent epimerase/dehydratase family protein [Anaerolineae bacterium]|nr:NAD-dependent epimerase/dehydratase family protein [Anaerolineae bacterium]